MATTLTHLDFPSTDPTHFVHIISNLLSPEECAEIIKSHTNLEPSNLTLGTIRTREQFDDEALVALLWSRMGQFYIGNKIKDKDGFWWKAKGLNPHFRLSKYEKSIYTLSRCQTRLTQDRRKIHRALRLSPTHKH